ncbi:uncharacterized protein LOC124810142 isoform X2 [Hydra vulgaris]|uniref:uncharacterized protein LOC124810142 isoform X2 n=1 Tax=Hydra vulgaris TaxID=6087 RepID=UPI001F5E5D80|nr:uncharacterized protein LOC124810142 isoform X3 [Hydra vulgaris]
MRILCNIQIKTSIGISFKNPYIFASGKKSESHCSGWHAMTSVCEDLPLENKKQLNATTNRHRISTLMASISMTDSERNLFYDHMGHSEAINKHIYQAPPAIMQLSNTGLRLTCIDKGQPCETPAKMAKKYHTEPIYNYENHYKDAFSYESDSSRCDATKGKDSQFSTSAQTAEEELMQPSSSFGAPRSTYSFITGTAEDHLKGSSQIFPYLCHKTCREVALNHEYLASE